MEHYKKRLTKILKKMRQVGLKPPARSLRMMAARLLRTPVDE